MKVENVRRFEHALDLALREIEARAKAARDQNPLSKRNALQEIRKAVDAILLADAG